MLKIRCFLNDKIVVHPKEELGFDLRDRQASASEPATMGRHLVLSNGRVFFKIELFVDFCRSIVGDNNFYSRVVFLKKSLFFVNFKSKILLSKLTKRLSSILSKHWYRIKLFETIVTLSLNAFPVRGANHGSLILLISTGNPASNFSSVATLVTRK